jgi:hypothetical protein
MQQFIPSLLHLPPEVLHCITLHIRADDLNAWVNASKKIRQIFHEFSPDAKLITKSTVIIKALRQNEIDLKDKNQLQQLLILRQPEQQALIFFASLMLWRQAIFLKHQNYLNTLTAEPNEASAHFFMLALNDCLERIQFTNRHETNENLIGWIISQQREIDFCAKLIAYHESRNEGRLNIFKKIPAAVFELPYFIVLAIMISLISCIPNYESLGLIALKICLVISTMMLYSAAWVTRDIDACTNMMINTQMPIQTARREMTRLYENSLGLFSLLGLIQPLSLSEAHEDLTVKEISAMHRLT